MSDDALITIVPEHVRVRALRRENEMVFPFPEVKEMVHLAAGAGIAVLGVETFQILKDGLLVKACSGYEIALGSSWSEFVRMNNLLALEFIEEHRLGEDHGYILTATSEQEFRSLR